MSHGDAVVREPEGFRVGAHTDVIPIAAMEDPERGLYAVQFHPEVTHTLGGIDVLKRFLYDGCGLLPDWTPVERDRARGRRDPRAGRRRPGPLRALGRRRLGGRGAPGASRGRRSAHVRVRRHGLNREDEPEQVEETFGRHFRIPLVHVKAADRFLGEAGRGDRPRGEAQGDRRGVHPRLRGGRARPRGRAVPGAGHALSGRDRVGLVDGGQHQEPPQRGRAARGHGVRAGRAAARPVQGRGPPGGRGARAAGGDRVAPAVPRAGSRGADRRRGHGRAAVDAPRRRRDRARRDPPRRAGARDVAGVRACCSPTCSPSA